MPQMMTAPETETSDEQNRLETMTEETISPTAIAEALQEAATDIRDGEIDRVTLANQLGSLSRKLPHTVSTEYEADQSRVEVGSSRGGEQGVTVFVPTTWEEPATTLFTDDELAAMLERKADRIRSQDLVESGAVHYSDLDDLANAVSRDDPEAVEGATDEIVCSVVSKQKVSELVLYIQSFEDRGEFTIEDLASELLGDDEWMNIEDEIAHLLTYFDGVIHNRDGLKSRGRVTIPGRCSGEGLIVFFPE